MFDKYTNLALTVSAVLTLLLNSLVYWHKKRRDENDDENDIYRRIAIESVWLVAFNILISGYMTFIPIGIYTLAKLFMVFWC